RAGVIERKLTPVFLGSAYKNKGIQALLDAVVEYLPAPNDRENYAFDVSSATPHHAAEPPKIKLVSDPKKEVVAMAFKIDNQVYGQLTYIRIYQGTIRKGMDLVNVSTGKKIKVGRLIRMHANSMEDISEGLAGDIVALYGVDCSLGDTFVSGHLNISLKSVFVPEPILSLAIKTNDKKSNDNLAKALNRFQKEDPTFRSFINEETSETIIKGMGELHLEVYVERMKREYAIDLQVGMPQVAYRETITGNATFDYTYRKQTGGRGQYARVCGMIEPSGVDDNIFIDAVKGGVIPSSFMPSCEKGFYASLEKGHLTGFPLIGVKMTINDGNYHPVDSQTISFEMATILTFKENYQKVHPRILEPIMRLNIETPSEFRGTVIGSVNQRRGVVIETSVEGHATSVEATIPLSEVFGYATILRSLTQGKAEFTLEFLKYDLVPKSIELELVKAK
ncbi:MAG: EF-Tu/IF-2/RF-3 family GTPase, partial [Candidatus Cloacimonetes bacterium]|nr:EF-Tu/IF-2/RF-3 family GTPase [Candidatus Cloacimonadota bacterium]